LAKSLFLLDGNSLINRAFYALPPLTSRRGEPTNAVYGLTMMLLRLMEDYQPDQILVAFDLSGPTFRHERFGEYKAHRKPMPEELRSQIPLMKALLDKMGIPRLELAGWEADDLIGTAAIPTTSGFNVGVAWYTAEEFGEPQVHADQEAVFVVSGEGEMRVPSGAESVSGR